MKSLIAAVFFAAGAMALLTPAARCEEPSPQARIGAARSRLVIGTDTLGGPGGDILRAATVDAQYVALGEDHGTNEIARFADGLFGMLQPHGFNTVVVETGPLVTARLRQWLAQPRGREAYVDFERQYPGTLAFFGWQSEWAFLEHASVRSGKQFELWGLDQELMGSPGFILTSILAEHPGAHSTQLVKALLARNDAAYAIARQSGSPQDMLLMQAHESDFQALVQSLRADGNARSQHLAQSLLETFKIYINCCNNQARLSNHERDMLMKRTFLAYERARPNPERRVLFKFGEEHIYRGFNPYNYDGIGNFLAEYADANGTSGVHILALGISGTQTKFAGIAKPWATSPYSLDDDDHARFKFLAPFIAQSFPDGYTLYDLRPFRTQFDAMRIADPGFQKLVFGYDFLVLIAHTTADPPIDPSVF